MPLITIAWALCLPTILLAAAATLGSLSSSRAWHARICDFPRVQIFLVILFASLLATATGTYAILHDHPVTLNAALLGTSLGIALPTLALHGRRILPFLPITRPEVPWSPGSPKAASTRSSTFELPPLESAQLPRLRLVIANIDFENDQPKQDLANLIASAPDILILIECDDSWTPPLDEARDKYPHQVREIRPDGLGMALLSKHPIEHSEVIELFTRRRPSIWATILLRTPQGPPTKIGIASIHPIPPGLKMERVEIEVPENPSRAPSTPRDIELIRVAQRILDNDTIPWIVAGDFNDVGWSDTTRSFKQVSGLRDPRVGRGLFNTYPAHLWGLRYPLDHVMLPEAFTLIRLLRLPRTGSDHFPLLADIELSRPTP